MAVINMIMTESGFTITFGRNEDSLYEMKLSVEKGLVGDHTVFLLATSGLTKDCLGESNGSPLYIAQITKPMGDTAKLEEIVAYYEDIVSQTSHPEDWPIVVLTAGRIVAGTAMNATVGVLLSVTDLFNENPVATPIVHILDSVNIADALSCLKCIELPGIPPEYGVQIDHQFFAQQALTALVELSGESVPEEINQFNIDDLESELLYS